MLSAYAPAGRKAFWMAIVVAMMALTHTTLLVLATAEISKQISGTNGEIAAFGAIVFKLYRIAVPLLLTGVWIICSRETLFAVDGPSYFKALHKPDRKTTGVRKLWMPRVFAKDLQSRLPNPPVRRGTPTRRLPSPALRQGSL